MRAWHGPMPGPAADLDRPQRATVQQRPRRAGRSPTARPRNGRRWCRACASDVQPRQRREGAQHRVGGAAFALRLARPPRASAPRPFHAARATIAWPATSSPSAIATSAPPMPADLAGGVDARRPTCAAACDRPTRHVAAAFAPFHSATGSRARRPSSIDGTRPKPAPTTSTVERCCDGVAAAAGRSASTLPIVGPLHPASRPRQPKIVQPQRSRTPGASAAGLRIPERFAQPRPVAETRRAARAGPASANSPRSAATTCTPARQQCRHRRQQQRPASRRRCARLARHDAEPAHHHLQRPRRQHDTGQGPAGERHAAVVGARRQPRRALATQQPRLPRPVRTTTGPAWRPRPTADRCAAVT